MTILFLETTLRKPSRIFFSPRSTTVLNFIKFSLFAISPIESLYFMLTLSVVSSVLSCSQPSCCHREKNGLHFLLQMKQALTFQFGCVDRSIRHQNTWRGTRTPEIGFNPNKPVSTVTWIKFYCTESQKDLFTWKHSANKKLDKCLTICYKVWMISKCYWYNFGVLSQPFAPQNATKHYVLA